jgi:hypothetical protein
MAAKINNDYCFNPIYSVQQANNLPTKNQADEIFWKLGDCFWKQCIDGQFHKYGPTVFDEGLHGGPKEPGFYASLKEGCRFTAEHLAEPPSSFFYKELHKKLCAHFKGLENNTLMPATQAGEYRNMSLQHEYDIKTISPEAKMHYALLALNEFNSIWYSEEQVQRIKEFDNLMQYSEKQMELIEKRLEKFCPNLDPSRSNQNGVNTSMSSRETGMDPFPLSSSDFKSWVAAWRDQWAKKIPTLQEYIKNISKEMSIPALCSINLTGDKVTINYTCNFDEIAQAVPRLFDRYNQKIDGINAKLKNAYTDEQIQEYRRGKISAIAEFFQLLEWLHPFPDGQGRTDLVLLAKILTDQGFNPPILEEPYFSSREPLIEWENYLSKGMELWKETST